MVISILYQNRVKSSLNWIRIALKAYLSQTRCLYFYYKSFIKRKLPLSEDRGSFHIKTKWRNNLTLAYLSSYHKKRIVFKYKLWITFNNTLILAL